MPFVELIRQNRNAGFEVEVMLIGTIEIVMRKIDASGSTSETVLVSLQGVESQEVTLSSDIFTFPSITSPN